MFNTTQIDKLRRNISKYRNTKQKLLYSAPRIALCCIVIFFIAFIYYIYCHGFSSKSIQPASTNEQIFSDDVTNLYNTFIEQFNFAQHNPMESLKHKVPIPENTLFQRTKTIQYLVDYTHAATKELYADKYLSNPNYHHVICEDIFSEGIQYEISMAQIQMAVETFINTKDSIYGSIFKQFAERTIITEQNCGGLRMLIGDYGITAKENIARHTCIGHFYGDESLRYEFMTEFAWDIYGELEDHPFKLKWDYWMTIPYDIFSDERLRLQDMNLTIAMDAYHLYDHIKYGKQQLSEEKVPLKQNYEPFINDARKELYDKKLNPSDRYRKNCEFVYCSVDGVLMTFVIAVKDIKVGDQLFAYYGPFYGEDIYDEPD